MRWQMENILAADANDAFTPIDQPHDRAKRRCPPAAIAPQQRHDLSSLQRERHAVQDMGFPVPGMEIL
jgi:hypothetical protein